MDELHFSVLTDNTERCIARLNLEEGYPMNPCNALLAFLTAIFVILTSAPPSMLAALKIETALAERHGERPDLFGVRAPLPTRVQR